MPFIFIFVTFLTPQMGIPTPQKAPLVNCDQLEVELSKLIPIVQGTLRGMEDTLNLFDSRCKLYQQMMGSPELTSSEVHRKSMNNYLRSYKALSDITARQLQRMGEQLTQINCQRPFYNNQVLPLINRLGDLDSHFNSLKCDDVTDD